MGIGFSIDVIIKIHMYICVDITMVLYILLVLYYYHRLINLGPQIQRLK